MRYSCVIALLLAAVTAPDASPEGQATAPAGTAFDSPVRQHYVVDGATYDRSGRLTIDEFRIEPLGPVTDPLLDFFATYLGYMGGGIRTNGTLGDKPFTVTVDLNEWFRFDTPGSYRISVRSNRVTTKPSVPLRLVPWCRSARTQQLSTIPIRESS